MAKSGRGRECSEEHGVIGRQRPLGESQNRNFNARSLPGSDFANSVRSFVSRQSWLNSYKDLSGTKSQAKIPRVLGEFRP